MNTRSVFKTIVLAVLLGFSFDTFSAPMTVKMGTLLPKGSIYHRTLQEMGEQWRHVQGEKSRFIIYTDGSQGGEADVVRRMRIGQLNAAVLSVVGLSEIDSTVTALQFIPMAFQNWREVDYVRERLRQKLEQRMRAKGFVVLFWVEGGWVHFFSKEAAVTPEDFKGRKVFVWAGDTQQVGIMKSLGYQPVVLETNDILPGLQSGLISVVAVPPVYALAGQIDRPASYMLGVRWVPIVGATVISEKAWKTMNPDARDALKNAAEQAGRKLRKRRQVQEDAAIAAMQKRGLKVQTPTSQQTEEWQFLAESVYPKIRGSKIPADIFDQVMELVSEYEEGTK